jgi:hypothetical protein
MVNKLWYMNADFEMELANPPNKKYFCSDIVSEINQKLAPHLLWLAQKGDVLILAEPWSNEVKEFARKQEVELVSPTSKIKYPEKFFTPWGWTPSSISVGEKFGAIVNKVDLELIARINSKLFSFQLEKEWKIALPTAAVISSFPELEEIVKVIKGKWVIKSPMGVAARERVLGNGSSLTQGARVWIERKFKQKEQLIFQPWLEVIREYGIAMYILPNGEIDFVGVSDLQTNGAGTGIGYLLGRQIPSNRLVELKNIAKQVGNRLFQEGYTGPAGVDALEHSRGLHPLLEINARYTMGFVAIAVEKALSITTPTLWQAKI